MEYLLYQYPRTLIFFFILVYKYVGIVFLFIFGLIFLITRRIVFKMLIISNDCLYEKAAYLFSSEDKYYHVFFHSILTFINQIIPTLLILLPTLFAVNADQMFFFLFKHKNVCLVKGIEF